MSEPTHFDTPTPTQRALLEYVLEHGGIERMPGGFWVKPGFNGNPHMATHFGTSTVDACKRREWLRPGIDHQGKPEYQRVHILTPHGLAAIRPKPPAGEPA